ncbi:MAG: hypothetical protein RLZZ205_587 [Bacteroidota bacterium]
MKTKTMKVSQWMLAVILALATYGCQPKEEQDTTRPIIGNVTLNDLAQETHELSPGQSFVVTMPVTDDEQLSQLKIGVHSADDGHGHVDLPGYEGLENAGTWSYTRIFDLSGTMASPTATIAVPDTISGIWHLEIMAIDQSGNESEERVYNLVVLP